MDQIEERRAWARLLENVDAELREESTPEFQAERAEEIARRRMWRELPPVRLRRRVQLHRLTESESALLDQEGV